MATLKSLPVSAHTWAISGFRSVCFLFSGGWVPHPWRGFVWMGVNWAHPGDVKCEAIKTQDSVHFLWQASFLGFSRQSFAGLQKWSQFRSSLCSRYPSSVPHPCSSETHSQELGFSLAVPFWDSFSLLRGGFLGLLSPSPSHEEWRLPARTLRVCAPRSSYPALPKSCRDPHWPVQVSPVWTPPDSTCLSSRVPGSCFYLLSDVIFVSCRLVIC